MERRKRSIVDTESITKRLDGFLLEAMPHKANPPWIVDGSPAFSGDWIARRSRTSLAQLEA